MHARLIYRIAVLVLSTAGFGLSADYARAQSYPSRPITFVVPYGAGSGNDVIGRIVAQKLSETLGQSVVAENRVGAGGAIAVESTAKAPPNGYTIVIASTSQIINQYLFKVRYDMVRDFAPVSFLGSLPYVLAVTNSSSARSMNELVALAKSKPGKINYAAVRGAAPHFMGEMLKSARGLDIMMIPYKSTTDADADVISGRVEIWFTTVASALPQVKSGTVRVLGVAGDKRAAALPEVPTMVEAGFPALDVSADYYILAPAGTPKPIIAALNAEIVKAIDSKDVRDRLLAAGVKPSSSTPEELDLHVRNEVARWGNIVKETGIRAD